MRRIVVLILVIVALAGAAPVCAASKHAFVVGIGQYDSLGPERQLPRAASDAAAVASTLRDLGYEVTTTRDHLRRDDFYELWAGFLDKVQSGDTVVIYYSGHGVQIDRENYLLPRNVPRMASANQSAARSRSIRVGELMADIDRRKPRVTVMILDACRDNPFEPPGKNAADKGGLGGMTAPVGTFLMYAAGPGQIALEQVPGAVGQKSADTDELSLYTRKLVPLLKTKGLGIIDLALRLREEVSQAALAASHTQRPAFEHNLDGAFCFAGCEVAVAASDPRQARSDSRRPSPPLDNDAAELEYWDAIKNSTDHEEFRAYLRAFPDGRHVPHANLLIRRLQGLAQPKSADTASAAGPPADPKAPPPPGRLAGLAPPLASRPTDKQMAPPSAPQMQAAEPQAKTAAAAEPSSPAAARAQPSQQATGPAAAACDQLFADPPETLMSYAVLVGDPDQRGDRKGEGYMLAFAASARDVCTAAAKANPGNDRLALQALLTDAIWQAIQVALQRSGVDERPAMEALFEATVERVKPIADRGLPDAMALMALVNVPRLVEAQRTSDETRANALFEEIRRAALRAAEAGSAWGWLAAGMIHLQRKEKDEGLKLLRRAADEGVASIGAGVGIALIEGGTNLKDEDKPAAVNLIRRSAERGSNIGRALLATVLADASFGPVSIEESARLLSQIAKEGSALATFGVANVLLQRGDILPPPLRKDVFKNAAEALQLYRTAAAKGDPVVTLAVADVLGELAGGNSDILKGQAIGDEILALYRRAAEAANSWVIAAVADRFASGANVPQNIEEAMRLYDRAAGAGDALVALRIGETLAQAALKVGDKAVPLPKNEAEAVRVLRLAAGKGDAEVTLKVADMFAAGGGIPADKTEAGRLYALAGDTGNGTVALKVAEAFATLDGLPDASAAAAKYYLKAAEQGRGNTLLVVAKLFADGQGVKQSREEASRLYRRAAETGDATTQLAVADVFGLGKGVFVNQMEADKWYRAAAEKGDGAQVLAAAIAFAEGKAVPKNPAEALRLLKVARERAKWEGEVLFKIVDIYEKGVLVPRDNAEAFAALKQAELYYHRPALERLPEVYDKGLLGQTKDAKEAAAFALKWLARTKELPAATFDAWSKTWSADFRRAVQQRLKDSGDYSGAIDGTFGAAVKRALETHAKK